MQDNTDYTMLYRLAKYYYEDKLSQSEIAQKEHISRPHISRLLDKARECGIVDIKVSLPPELQISKTRQDLKEKLCLQDAIIAFSPTDSMKNNRRASMNIATAAAHHLPNLIAEAKNIGIFSRDDVYDNENIFDSPIYPANSELYDEFCDECGFDIAEYFLFLARQIENN